MAGDHRPHTGVAPHRRAARLPGASRRRDDPQQARFAAAVGAGQGQRAARGKAEREAGKDQPLAAPAGEIGADQLVGRLHPLSDRRTARRLRRGSQDGTVIRDTYGTISIPASTAFCALLASLGGHRGLCQVVVQACEADLNGPVPSFVLSRRTARKILARPRKSERFGCVRRTLRCVAMSRQGLSFAYPAATTDPLLRGA